MCLGQDDCYCQDGEEEARAMERLEMRPYIEYDVRYGNDDDDTPSDMTPDEPNGLDEIMAGYSQHIAAPKDADGFY